MIVMILAYQLAIDEVQQKATEPPEELTLIPRPLDVVGEFTCPIHGR
jgi:hypothetical protein